MKLLAIIIPLSLLALSACAPSKPEVKFASENTIELIYDAYDLVPTVTAEAIDIAAKHCESHNRGFKYIDGRALNPLISTKEMHVFMCTNDLADKKVEITVKK